MLTRQELDEIQLVLENEQRWYVWCQKNLQSCDDRHWFNALGYYHRQLGSRVCPAQGFYLKAYFTWRYFTEQRNPPPEFRGPWKRDGDIPPYKARNPSLSAHDAEKLTMLVSSYGGHSFAIPIQDRKFTVNETSTRTEFNPMTPLAFKTVYQINGHDLSKLSNEDIYAAIQAEEARIEKMKTIKNQPKSLKAEIASAEAQLAALITHLDSKA